MRCHRVRASLSDYVDERMPLAAYQEVRRHLEVCPGCREEWLDLAAIKRLLAAARAPQAPEGFWAETCRRLRQPHRRNSLSRSRFRRPWWDAAWQRAPALAGGTGAVLTVVLTFLSASLDARDASAIDARAAVAHHVAYSSRHPLADRASLELLIAESLSRELD